MLQGAQFCNGKWVRHAVALFPKSAGIQERNYDGLRQTFEKWYPEAETILFFSYDAFEEGVPVSFNFSWNVNSRDIDAEVVR